MAEDSHPRLWRQHKPTAMLVVLLLIVHAGLGIHTAFQQSVTNDEFWHIPTGFWNLTHGRFHYENLNPPLLRAAAAVPLIAAGAEAGDVVEPADKETRADAFVAANRERYSLLVSMSRIVPVIVSVVTGWILASWALELFGVGSAALVAALWSLSPNAIAHGSLVTTDVPAAGALLVSIRMACRMAGEPDIRRAACLGLCLGCAQLVKFTCLIGVPLAVAAWLILRVRNSGMVAIGTMKAMGLWGLAAGVMLLVINAGYLFQGTGQPLSSYHFSSNSMNQIVGVVSQAGDLPVPFPRDYVEGIDHQRHIMEGAHPAYLDGKLRLDGFPDYYFKAWWYKTPHAIQLLCVLTVIAVLWPKRRQRQFRLQVILMLPVCLLLILASGSSMQLGLRYLLPAFPFVFLWASQLASLGQRLFGLPQLVSVVLAVGLAASLRFHPEHLSYFNELAGGPANGHQHLLDSNVDWGQGLLKLREYLDRQKTESVYLAYFGAVNPTDFGISYTTPPGWQPDRRKLPELQPGTYVVSANFLMGRPGMVRDPDGKTWPCGPHYFAWFQFFEPDARIGYSLFVYHLDAEDAARLHAQ